MRFGEDGNTYAALATSQYIRFNVSAGPHRFFARGPVGDASVATLTAVTGVMKCLRAYPNPARFAKAFIPFPQSELADLVGQTFTIEEAPCPSRESLASFTEVVVEYDAR